MINILVLGSAGMLGSATTKVLAANSNFQVYQTHRGMFDPLKNKLTDFPKPFKPDYVINCIGVIKPVMMENLRDAIYVNSVFPFDLANYCAAIGAKLIHITTDCVYSGKRKAYIESDTHDALDEYGKSKSLGEPDNCMVLRTSIIGPETFHNRSLVSWFLKQTECQGYINHFWNGITTKEYGKVCEWIIVNDLYTTGKFHIFSDVVSKYQMLMALKQKYMTSTIIHPYVADVSINRTLATTEELNEQLQIQSFQEMINEM